MYTYALALDTRQKVTSDKALRMLSATVSALFQTLNSFFGFEIHLQAACGQRKENVL